jgi:hypothetical protein
MQPQNWTTLATNWQTDHEDYARLGYYLSAKGYRLTDVLTPDDLQSLANIEAEHFLGQYESPAEFARESLTNAYGYELEALPTMIQNAIDWAQVWDQDYRHDCLDVEIKDPEGYHWLIWHAH